MDEVTRNTLFLYGKAEQFEKWLAEEEQAITDLLNLPVHRWQHWNVTMAIAVMLTQRTIIRAHQLKEQARQHTTNEPMDDNTKE